MSSRESIYGDLFRAGWKQTGLNEYTLTRDGKPVAWVRATHARAYLNGEKYPSLMAAIKAAEVSNDRP